MDAYRRNQMFIIYSKVKLNLGQFFILFKARTDSEGTDSEEAYSPPGIRVMNTSFTQNIYLILFLFTVIVIIFMYY